MNLFDLMSPINKQRMGGQDEIASLLGDPTALAGQLGTAAPPARKPLSGFQQMKDRFFGVPEGMRGLLAPEDLSGAQHEGMLGLGLSLLANSGARTADQQVRPMEAIGQALQAAKGAHAGSLQNAAGARAAAMEFEGKKLQLDRSKQLAEGRKAIVAKYPMPQSPDRMMQWIDQVLPQFIELNDEETVARLSEIRKSLGGQQQAKEPGQWMEVPGPDGKPRTMYVTQSQVPEGGIPTYEKPLRDTTDALTMVSRLNGERNLINDFEKRTTGVQTTVDAYMGAKQAEKMGGTGDLQILYSFIRALDPQSVVREGEVSLARSAASLWSQAHILKNKFESEGGVLSPVMRTQMIELMRQMVELKVDRSRRAMKDTQRRAQRFGLEIDLTDPLEKYDAWRKQDAAPAQPAPAASGGAAPRQDGESIADYLKRTRVK